MRPLDLAAMTMPVSDALAMREIHCFEDVDKKVLKNALNLSFETGSRSAKDCTPRRKIALSLRAIVQRRMSDRPTAQ